MVPHLTIFSFIFIFLSFQRDFTFLHTSFCCIKLMVLQKEDLQRKRKLLSPDSLNLEVLRMLGISQFLHQNEKRRKSWKHKCVVEQCFTCVLEEKFSGWTLHRDGTRHLHIHCSLASFFFLSPLLLSHCHYSF